MVGSAAPYNLDRRGVKRRKNAIHACRLCFPSRSKREKNSMCFSVVVLAAVSLSALTLHHSSRSPSLGRILRVISSPAEASSLLVGGVRRAGPFKNVRFLVLYTWNLSSARPSFVLSPYFACRSLVLQRVRSSATSSACDEGPRMHFVFRFGLSSLISSLLPCPRLLRHWLDLRTRVLLGKKS